jgi:hypothetical protein
MPGQFSLKPWMNAPFEQNVGQDTNAFLVWAQSALNQLISKGNAPPSQGLQSLQNNLVNPTTSQIQSLGSRTSSVTTAITFTFTATTATFYWDGTNGSFFLQIGRDDGSMVGPTNVGSPFLVTGLSANTYRFYPYWDENLQMVVFASNSAAVGNPAVAFLNPNFAAAQQQILRGHIPLGTLLVTTGVTLTGGTGSGSGGSGGGGAGAGGNRGQLQP